MAANIGSIPRAIGKIRRHQTVQGLVASILFDVSVAI